MRLGFGFVLFFAFVLAFAPAALADWDHEVKWDQLDPYSASWFDLQPSYIIGSSSKLLVADDFVCGETGFITDIEFHGTCPQIDNLTQFRITFWDESPTGASIPGNLAQSIMVNPADADGIGWKTLSQAGDTSYLFKINLPEDVWFMQEEGNTYWIGIQGVFPQDGQFNWCCRPLGLPTNGDDAVKAKDCLIPSGSQWDSLVWVNTAGMIAVIGEREAEQLGNTTILQSADMSFKLTGIEYTVPEPGLLALVGVGLLAIWRKRCR